MSKRDKKGKTLLFTLDGEYNVYLCETLILMIALFGVAEICHISKHFPKYINCAYFDAWGVVNNQIHHKLRCKRKIMFRGGNNAAWTKKTGYK